MYSLAAKHLMMLSFKPHLATLVFIAAGSISQALGQAGGIINGFALIGAFAGLVPGNGIELTVSGVRDEVRYSRG